MNDYQSIRQQARLIESDNFPFEFLSQLGERESWRKEIYRPIYHIHKWWAKRLGSIFRGIILGCLLPDDEDLSLALYRKHDFSAVSVFDPFMGSGTTLGEAHKLGCFAIGRDINPVASELVRIALGPLNQQKLQSAFNLLSGTVGERIRKLYIEIYQGLPAEVLYFFWVNQAPCPKCDLLIDLFPNRIIARNASPGQKNVVQVCCPRCDNIFPAKDRDQLVRCNDCGLEFNPQIGNAKGSELTCPACSHQSSIISALRKAGHPPTIRLYGKLILCANGEKRYIKTASADIQRYQECSELLQQEIEQGSVRLPDMSLTDGYNTRQVLNYNYRNWRDFFNDRQLLALGWLQKSISELPDVQTRDALLLLFSGVLEFNNLFASYKGEGTGAVRHMFSHHILKPERMPIEANVWGTPKSSGAFSTLYKSRLLRAIEYRKAPFEITLNGSGKNFKCNSPFTGEIMDTLPADSYLKHRKIYLTCGSSDHTELPTESVDFVITDPPFFDNVHYSELADFFFAWQKLYPHGFITAQTTTRHPSEVQDVNAGRFTSKLEAVFLDCYRVLKPGGLLVFTYHHSRAEGWKSLAEAIVNSGFSVTNAHPVKAEMSVAMPKTQAKSPIQFDMVIVCKKRIGDNRSVLAPDAACQLTAKHLTLKVARLASASLFLSRNDYRIIAMSHFISLLGPIASADDIIRCITDFEQELDRIVDALQQDKPQTTTSEVVQPQQLSLF